MTYELTLDLQGNESDVCMPLSPVLGIDGSADTTVGTSVVLANQRAAQDTNFRTVALMERARAEMEQYLAFAAHDLRAPMRRMAGLASMLQDELPDSASEAREIALMMQEVSQKAQGLISDVLNFSEANNAPVHIEEFCLRTVTRDIFTVLDPLHKHDLTAEEAALSADRVALQIILRNLVDNAIKHTDKPVVRLHIGVENGPAGPVIYVSDNGPGLPDSDLKFLSGQNFQYGTGFGLLGIRRLIQSRGGQLTAQRRPDGGIIFRVTLPGSNRIAC